MVDVELHTYDDDSPTAAETVIITDTTEFVVVEYDNRDEHRVFQREPGETEPHTQLAPERKPLQPESE